MKDRLRGFNLTQDEAADVVSHVTAQRVRWQKQYDAGDIGMHKLLDALVIISKGESSTEAELRKTIVLSSRQLGASKSRETKLKKQVSSLKAQLSTVVENINELEDENHRLEDAARGRG